jgi:hypothetical protein
MESSPRPVPVYPVSKFGYYALCSLAKLACRGAYVENQTWVTVAVYSDRLSAEATLGLLAAEEMPAYISSDEHVPGLGIRFAVLVPSDVVPRAHWLLRAPPISDGELTYLATGELSENGEH